MHFTSTTSRRRAPLALVVLLVALLAQAGTARAATVATTGFYVPVPRKAGIYNVSFDFTRTSAVAPLLGARSAQLLGLPKDVTLMTGVRVVPNTNRRRWRGIATMIRFRTGDAPATGTSTRVRVNSNLPLRVRVSGFATDTTQATEQTLGGRWLTRVGRRVQHEEVIERGGVGPAQLLTFAGNILAGRGNPKAFHLYTGTIPPDFYRVDVQSRGGGSGVIHDKDHVIECTVDAGAASGRCSGWFPAGTPNSLTAVPSLDPLSAFVSWYVDCSGTEPTCDLGAPAGGRWIIGDAEFRIAL